MKTFLRYLIDDLWNFEHFNPWSPGGSFTVQKMNTPSLFPVFQGLMVPYLDKLDILHYYVYDLSTSIFSQNFQNFYLFYWNFFLALMRSSIRTRVKWVIDGLTFFLKLSFRAIDSLDFWLSRLSCDLIFDFLDFWLSRLSCDFWFLTLAFDFLDSWLSRLSCDFWFLTLAFDFLDSWLSRLSCDFWFLTLAFDFLASLVTFDFLLSRLLTFSPILWLLIFDFDFCLFDFWAFES